MTKSSPTRVLHVIGAMDRGGAETLVMNLYRNIDRNLVQFDFLVNETRECDFDQEIKSLGGRIYSIPRFTLINYSTYAKACHEFFSTHSYRIVHGHIAFPSAIYLKEAKRDGSYTILHSHAQKYPLSPSQAVFRLVSGQGRRWADYFLACSQQAGLDRFGKEIVSGPNFHVLKNGIDTRITRFSATSRKAIRRQLGIDSCTPLFGHVGRLTPIKNHDFLLSVFAHIKELLPNAKLALVGRGECESELRKRAEQLGISDSVLFVGVREDVPSLLSAFDVFVFPSFSEGLAIAVVEAQACGLPCLVSTGVPTLTRIGDNIVYSNLSDGAAYWAKTAVKMYASGVSDRTSSYKGAVAAGFDIKASADWMEKFYLSHIPAR